MSVVKVLGPVAILSRFSVALSDLAYAGVFYHLLLSGLAHLGVRKPKGAASGCGGPRAPRSLFRHAERCSPAAVTLRAGGAAELPSILAERR